MSAYSTSLWGRVTGALLGALGAAAAASLSSLPVAAQVPGIVAPGNAVVTGFSQAIIATAPPGADPYDYYMVNPAGPSARVVDLGNVGAPGVLANAPKPFSVSAAQVGQVFGVAVDNAARPNIYVAATSAYGLEITTPDQNGNPHRIHTGTIGATYALGQFGPQVFGGGPGSIWRVDGTTGAVSLFANVAGVGPASLGGIAFDPTTQTIFVADRTSGRIYRYGTNGALKGTFDHGTEARPSGGLPPIPVAAGPVVNIQSAAFSTENPATWGFAAPARRPFALAVYKNRLYYSVAQGPQIWSAGIGAGGSIGGKDARLEIELPSLDNGVEITSIDFDAQGLMYAAERGATTGDYFLLRLAEDGQSRVVRYRPKLPGDPNPGLWSLIPDQYSIGMAPNYTNANGGVALNYGHRFDGSLDLTACRQTVWATGERLLDPGDGSTGFPNVDGIQGVARTLVQPQNMPPSQSWFVDYDDGPGYVDFRGHMGAITTPPCPVQASLPPPPPPPVFTCPAGTYFDGQQCIIIPTCPPGTSYANGVCMYPTCPPGFVFDNFNQCVPPPQVCPPGTFYYKGTCAPLACPTGMLLQPNGQCACPQGNYYFNGKCVPPAQCPVGSVQLGNGICICPLGLIFGNGVCQPQQQGCPANQELWNGYCVAKCPANQIHMPPNGQCEFPPVNCPPTQDYFNGLCVNKCPPGQDHTLPDGACKAPPISCPPSQDLFNNLCVAKCPQGQIHTLPNGACIAPPNCPPTQELWNGICVLKCASPLFEHKLPNGACGPIFTLPVGPIQTLCLGNNKEIWDGKCVDKCPGNQVHTQPNGDCKPPFVGPIGPIGPIILCLGADKEIWENKCVDKCPNGQVHKEPDGKCVLPVPQLPPLGPIQIGPLQVSPAALCAAQGKDVYKDKCVDKCTGNQVHKDPDGACGAPVIQPNLPVGPVNPVQTLSPAALCALQNKDLYNGKCIDKCTGPNQEHKAPNGTCGPIVNPIQVNPNLPIQILPSQTTCAAQNKDFYPPTMMCVDKCGPGQEHKAPNGACGLINAPIQVNPNLPIQILPSQTTCAAQNKDFYAPTMMCVDKCGPGQEHKAPNGACGLINAPIQVNPNLPIQVVPTQASCTAQGKDFFNGQCVDKCGAGQQHNPPNGACGPIPASAQSCAAQGKDFFANQCVDKCSAGQEHKAPNGACGPIPASAQTCAAQGKDFYAPNTTCVDKCGAGQQHNPPNGACGPIPASAQTCAAQGKDFYAPNTTCVDKCSAGQQHNPPNGACGPIPASAQTCAAQGKDFYAPTMACVDKCTGNQTHQAPDGKCGGGNAQNQGGNPPQLQVVPTQVICSAQGKDLFDGKCVDKCTGNQTHQPPDGKCAGPNAQNQGGQGGGNNVLNAIPTTLTCNVQGKDLFDGKCVDKCKANEVRADDGMCLAKAPNAPKP